MKVQFRPIITLANGLYIDMDKLVSIKGLVIRATPIIPDMKEGGFITTIAKNGPIG